MCGITGIFDFAGKRRMDRETIKRMTNAIAHRGPDSCNYVVDAGFAVGFCRLSIVDLAGGQQPMWNEQRTVLSVCNGEIFNHGELREQLEAREHRFTSKCDVEVLPHLYEEHGIDFVDKLSGQFAFAIYDYRRRRLCAARDQFGVVPFFYTIVDGLFIFGSEIKAILQHPAVSREVDVTGLDQILCFPGLVSPTTMFRGIKSLGSGHLLTVSESGVRVSEYWDLDFPMEGSPSEVLDERDYIDGVREHLKKSVRQRLMSDVPLGLYLSGGLDSSVVSAYACSEAPSVRRHSFGVSFNGEEMCERSYQESMSRFLDTTHHDVSFSSADVLSGLERAVYHAECPVKESYDTACLALSKQVKDTGVSVVLTGQGADELFGGYIGYRFDKFYNENPTYRSSDDEERKIRTQLWGDPSFAYDKDYVGLQRLKQRLYSPAVRAELPQTDALQSLGLRKERVEGRHVLHKRSYLDFKLRLADHLLADHGDRMAMANSVEIRHPFLDIDLVKFVSQIPPHIQLKGLTEKYVLRQAAASVVPPSIAQREKFGWFAHGTPQLLRANRESMSDLLSADRIRRQAYFDVNMVERLKARYGEDGFALTQPFEADLLLYVLSFTMLVEMFQMSSFS
jgi:asparagine synthase (glutamine-hydrolysing)